MKPPLPPLCLGDYIRAMIHRFTLTLALLFASAFALTASPVAAEDQDTNSKSMMERGAELFFEGLRQEIEPKLDELRGLAEKYGPAMTSFIEEMGPAFMEMVDEVKDWSRYSPPEMLPNGDIIIRKKPDPEGEEAVPDAGDAPKPGETDL